MRPRLPLCFPVLLCIFCTLTIQSRVFGQSLQVTNANTPPFTPNNLISNVFLGDGVEVTNIQFNGHAPAIGYFSGGSSIIGIDRGIIMTTGHASTISANPGAEGVGNQFSSFDNPSNANATELEALTTGDLRDVAVYIIKFIPTSDTLRFKYCFASEEYPEYACTEFNDVFGFFIQGPGYPAFTNIARIPNTTLPVTINNLHPANPSEPGCTPLNAQYYNANTNTTKQPVYDGFTDVFVAEAIVTPCQEYTIKLAIADVTDGAWDSGVFLEAKSFGTGSLRVSAVTVSNDGTITEGCAPGMLRFELPQPAFDTVFIDYNINGDAANGVDYGAVPMDLFIPTGQSFVEIPLQAVEDGVTEGVETIAIDVQRDPCNRDTIFIMIRENTLKAPVLQADTTICTNNATPILLNGTAPVPLPDPLVFTNDNNFTVSHLLTGIFAPGNSNVNVFGVLPATLGPGMIQSVCVNLNHPLIDDVDLFLISPDGGFLELSTDNGGGGDNYTNTCFTESASTAINFPGPFAPASAAPFTGNWLPEGPWSDLYGGSSNGTWKLQYADDSPGFNGTLDSWTITFAPGYRIDYAWTPSNGLSCTDCPIANALPTASTTYVVKATDNYGCEMRDSIHFTVLDGIPAPTIICDSVSPNSVTFAWDTVAYAQSYEISINNGPWMAPNLGDTSHIVSGISPLTPVEISVRGVGTLPCPAIVSQATCTNCAPPAATFQTVDNRCFGEQNGAISLQPDQMNGPYTYQIGSQANQSDSVFLNLAAGLYTVRVEDKDGCSTDFPIQINQPNELVAQASVVSPVSCYGFADAVASASSTGGTGAATYQWSLPSNPTQQQISGLAAGNYRVTAADQNGCRDTIMLTITQPDSIRVVLSPVGVKCFNGINGQINANVTGGTAPFTYAWTNGSSSPNPTNLPAGPYTVSVTDMNGCQRTQTSTVIQPSAIAAQTTQDSVSCFGSSTGTASIAASGGTPGYQYKWSDPLGQTTTNANNLSAGLYTVTISDANLCTTTASVAVLSPQALSVSESHTNALCFGTATGIATVTVTGGSGGYTFQWNDPAAQNSPTAKLLSAGTYQPTITDIYGCTATIQVNITEPAVLNASPEIKDVRCFGLSNGRITMLTTGGTQPYQYAWSTPLGNGPVAQGLSKGIYTVTITDLNGCTFRENYAVTMPDSIAAETQVTDLLCFNDASGKLTVSASGGIGALTYQWTGPNGFSAQGQSVNQLPAGNYTLLVQDVQNCQYFETVVINQPSLLQSLTPAISDTICFGVTDGSAELLATGGTAPYSYTWAGSASSAMIENQVAGIYAYQITDANGCTYADQTEIRQKAQLNMWAEATAPGCHNGVDGMANVSAIFYGTQAADLSGFTYKWSAPNQTNSMATGLTANQSYTVTATDAQGCTSTTTVTVPNQPPFVATVNSVSHVKCALGTDGTATVQQTGGTAPYTYLWSPNAGSQTTATATQLAAGQYKVTVTDQVGCPAVVQLLIEQPEPLKTTLTTTGVKCFGDQNGFCQAVASGGTSPYQYLWNSGHTSADMQNMAAGLYQLTIMDANGCTKTDETTVDGPAEPVQANARGRDPVCFQGDEGQIIFDQPVGGTPPYFFSLDNEIYNGSKMQLGLTAGTYTPYVRDSRGCTISLPPVVLQDRSQLTVNLGPDITIELGQDTALQAVVQNGAGPLTYVWSAEDSIWLSCQNCPNPSVELLQFQNTFELYVVDSLGCFAEDFVTIFIEKPRRVFVPTGFTPNGDMNNDILMVHGQDGVKLLEFKVFDRWGELVHTSVDGMINDQAIGWDGTFRGKPMDPGVFVWTLRVLYTDGVEDLLHGSSTLIR